MQVQTLSETQTTQALLNSDASVNFVLQIFLIKNSWKDISLLERVQFVNNEIAYYYKIVNIDYFIADFKKILKCGIMSFYLVNMTKHDIILGLP